MKNKCRHTFNLLLLWLALSIVGCGGSSSNSDNDNNTTSPSEVVPPVVTPPAEELTSSVYGLYEISVIDSEIMHMLLTKERSYIFSVANNSYPPTEKMCVSSENLLAFSDSLLVQTLIFNCTDSEDIIVGIELKDKTVSVDYSPEKMTDASISLANIVQITTPNFSKLTAGSYKTPERNDINISRLIAASSRETNIWVNVASRDIPIGGQCHDSLIFETDDLSSVEISDTFERVSIPYRSTDSQVGNNCTNSLLPNPSRVENINVHFYTLANGTYFSVIEQNTFITMGILYKVF
jgi:hypothetical protein